MGIQSLKTGSRSRSVMSGNTLIYPGDFESIATVSVGSGGSSSVSFSSIPSTFTHLQLRAVLRSTHTSEDYPTIKVNGTFLTVRHVLSANGGGTVQSSSGTGATQDWGAMPGTNTTSEVFSAFIIDFLDYANLNKNKTIRFFNGLDRNGAGAILFQGSLVASTSAISSLTFETYYSKNYAQYSHFGLYGARG